jgi:hypothetical protein
VVWAVWEELAVLVPVVVAEDRRSSALLSEFSLHSAGVWVWRNVIL